MNLNQTASFKPGAIQDVLVGKALCWRGDERFQFSGLFDEFLGGFLDTLFARHASLQRANAHSVPEWCATHALIDGGGYLVIGPLRLNSWAFTRRPGT